MNDPSVRKTTTWGSLLNILNPVRKQIGWTLIIISTLAWLGIGGLFLLDMSVAKQTSISTVLFIIGELSFFGSIPFLGKDIWSSFKKLFIKDKTNSLDNKCRFATQNLSIESWKPYLKETEKLNVLGQEIIEMLSDETTRFLPHGWSEIDSIEQSKKWIRDREEESFVFIASTLDTKKIAGLIFLTGLDQEPKTAKEIRIGFILSKEYWGKGLGNEMIAGLVNWCLKEKDITSITGGVMHENYASEKILRKNGFTISNSEHTGNIKHFTRSFS